MQVVSVAYRVQYVELLINNKQKFYEQVFVSINGLEAGFLPLLFSCQTSKNPVCFDRLWR
jgi:hypothetical protein